MQHNVRCSSPPQTDAVCFQSAPAVHLFVGIVMPVTSLPPYCCCSEDRLLRQILSQSTGDVFNMIAAALQHAGSRQDGFLMGAGAQGAGECVPGDVCERCATRVLGQQVQQALPPPEMLSTSMAQCGDASAPR